MHDGEINLFIPYIFLTVLMYCKVVDCSVYNSVFDWMLHLTFNFLKVTGIVFHNLKK